MRRMDHCFVRLSQNFQCGIKADVATLEALNTAFGQNFDNTTARGAARLTTCAAEGVRAEHKMPLTWPREGRCATRPGAGVTKAGRS
jgi:hypothetical protein